MSVELLDKMIVEDDFLGSYFVELQMYGEPLLAPNLEYFIRRLQEIKMKVGMSTNGTLMNLSALCKLDYLTISIDSANKETYEKLRKTSFDNLVSNIDLLLLQPKRPKIDLQVINFDKDELPELVNLAHDKHWDDVICRSVPDCFAAYQNRPWDKNRLSEQCINPLLSVSIQWDGDVCPCCFSAGKSIVYGSLNNKTLKEIWAGNMHKQFANSMRYTSNKNIMPCMLCYQRSPALFHQKMLMQEMKK